MLIAASTPRCERVVGKISFAAIDLVAPNATAART
jgi:hypothetical protein